MGKSSPSPPPPPDPEKTAAAQAAANKETAIAQRSLNQVDVYGPEGSYVYEPTGETTDDIDRFKVTKTLSPEQQQLYDLTTGAARKYGEIGNAQLDAMSGTLSQPIDFNSLGLPPQANEQAREATLEAMLKRAQPGMDSRRDSLETRLANQGFNRGTRAFDNEMDQFNRSENDFMLGADMQAGNEMARMYGLESNQRDRSINEMIMPRNQTLTELSSLLTGAQPNAPQFINTPQGQIAPADLIGATYGSYNGQVNAFNQQQQSNAASRQGLYSGLGSLGAAAIGKPSDRRLKKEIRQIGRLVNGLAVYLYRYIWGGPVQIGLMADEVKLIHPHAVLTMRNGYDAVDYAEAIQ